MKNILTAPKKAITSPKRKRTRRKARYSIRNARIKHFSHLIVPKSVHALINELCAEYSAKGGKRPTFFRNGLIDTVNTVFSQNLYMRKSIYDGIEIPYEVFKGRNAKFRRYLDLLIDRGLFRCDYTYSASAHQCMTYYVNPNMLEGEIVKVKYSVQKTQKDGKDVEIEPLKKTKEILSCMKLSIETDEIKPHVENLINRAYLLGKCKFNEEITPKEYKTKFFGSNQFFSDNDIFTSKGAFPLVEIKEKAKQMNVDYILYKSHIYLCEKEYFIERKISELRINAIKCLTKIDAILATGNMYVGINDTNNRLDNNITALGSDFRHLLVLDGQKMGNLDIGNCQFAILGKLLHDAYLRLTGKQNNTIDFLDIIKPYQRNAVLSVVKRHIIDNNIPADLELFINISKIGLFYEQYVEMTGGSGNNDDDRAVAKQTMFETLFSSRLNNTTDKVRLKIHFLTLVSIIDEIKLLFIGEFDKRKIEDRKGFEELCKKRHKRFDLATNKDFNKLGNAEFSVMLQTIESYIIVETILPILLEHYRVLSIHDSFLVKESELESVKLILIRELNKFFGVNGYKLKQE